MKEKQNKIGGNEEEMKGMKTYINKLNTISKRQCVKIVKVCVDEILKWSMKM
jgi:hypothetical protein